MRTRASRLVPPRRERHCYVGQEWRILGRSNAIVESDSGPGVRRPVGQSALVGRHDDFSPSSAKFSRKTLTLGSPINPKVRPSIAPSTNARTRSSGKPLAFATEAPWPKAVCGETSGSRPEDDVVTGAAGTGPRPAIAT